MKTTTVRITRKIIKTTTIKSSATTRTRITPTKGMTKIQKQL